VPDINARIQFLQSKNIIEMTNKCENTFQLYHGKPNQFYTFFNIISLFYNYTMYLLLGILFFNITSANKFIILYLGIR